MLKHCTSGAECLLLQKKRRCHKRKSQYTSVASRRARVLIDTALTVCGKNASSSYEDSTNYLIKMGKRQFSQKVYDMTNYEAGEN